MALSVVWVCRTWSRPTVAVTAVTDGQWRDAFESVFLGAVRLAREVAASLGETVPAGSRWVGNPIAPWHVPDVTV